MDVQLRIDEVLKMKNMTQVDLAKKIKRSKVTVNYWCSNRNLPSLSTLSIIAKVLNVKISDLIIEN
jgi:DNA-binding XRE family transcriptional regulator